MIARKHIKKKTQNDWEPAKIIANHMEWLEQILILTFKT